MPRPQSRDPELRQRYRDDWESYPGRPRGAEPPPAGVSHEPVFASWRWGQIPGWFGIVLVAGAAALATLATAVTGTGPGMALGVCVAGATLAASLAVQARAAYLLIPAPVLAYLAAAAGAGLAGGQAGALSRTALAAGAAQWIAGGFPAMTAGTLVAIAVTAARRPGRGRG